VIVASALGLTELIAVGVVSGAGGAIGGAFLRNRHERHERLKDLRLAASEAFLSEAIAATNVVATITHPNRREPVANLRELLQRLDGQGAALVTNVARMQLLFGPSDVSQLADQITSGLAQAIGSLQGDHPDFAKARELVLAMPTAAFTVAAHEAIT
jgi:hypothetical protein